MNTNIKEIDIDGIINYMNNSPISKAWLFGSWVNGTPTDKSDVDLLVKFDKDAKIGLFALSRMSRELEEISGRNVDLVIEGSLYPWIEEKVEKEKILIYERKNKG